LICEICVNLWFLLSFFSCVICGSPFRIPQGVFTVFFLVGIKKCGILGYIYALGGDILFIMNEETRRYIKSRSGSVVIDMKKQPALGG
ncbi:MAG: hypothetical protein P4L59_18565, partial [Desulfosporosinus sp.]|nr:hypothetical protein [Desulfosporosinus sp.]